MGFESFDHEQKLCSDDIFEILTRTSSLKTLDMCKCVSKNWNQLVHESTFMPLYCNRTKNMSGYFIQATIRSKNISVFVDRPEKDEKIEKQRAYRYYVCKPATRQWQTLPNPKLRYHTLSVAIFVVGSTPLRFKIVRLSKDQRVVKDYSMMKCEIFDSKAWRWRETKSPHLPCGEMITSSHPVVCAGSIHWLTNDENVLVFHEANESFEKFPLPLSVALDKSKQLVSYQGKLGLTCLRGRDGVMKIWTVEDYNTYRWGDEKSMSVSGLESHCKPCYAAGFYNEGIALFKMANEAVFYRLGDGSVTKVGLGMDMIGKCEFFQFRSDLEPVDLRGGRG
ncbi:hypothetical protein CASFOL_036854 [Castilleja foliolosa]|uniref:F-box associated beta-propeller type 3 domain-containing protein n=1 Tax=Castilleja foliolosa TaxID=1961234 RepID=A0ABD3BQ83_9LAMI